MGNTRFALEPVPGRSVETAACAPGADVGSFDVVTALALVQGPRPLAAHASPVHGLQTAGNCLLLSPDGVSELHQ